MTSMANQRLYNVVKSNSMPCCQIKTGTQHQILFFIIKDFGGKFHHSISEILLKFHYLYRLLTIQEIDVSNPRHNIL